MVFFRGVGLLWWWGCFVRRVAQRDKRSPRSVKSLCIFRYCGKALDISNCIDPNKEKNSAVNLHLACMNDGHQLFDLECRSLSREEKNNVATSIDIFVSWKGGFSTWKISREWWDTPYLLRFDRETTHSDADEGSFAVMMRRIKRGRCQ